MEEGQEEQEASRQRRSRASAEARRASPPPLATPLRVCHGHDSPHIAELKQRLAQLQPPADVDDVDDDAAADVENLPVGWTPARCVARAADGARPIQRRKPKGLSATAHAGGKPARPAMGDGGSDGLRTRPPAPLADRTNRQSGPRVAVRI